MNRHRAMARWLFAVTVLVAVMVVFGGWVRLTRSGLSMVEWHIATGVVPPLGQEAWQQAFEQYRQTPEYQKVNTGMSLAEYRAIYYREWGHRVLGRLAAGTEALDPFTLAEEHVFVDPGQTSLAVDGAVDPVRLDVGRR